jgi:Uma2 family endonuclease
MRTAPQLLTAEDLWRMNLDERCELVNGRLITMALAGFEHGVVIAKIATLLANYVEQHKLGLVLSAETGFILRRKPDTVRGADIAFVSNARLPNPIPKAYFPGAPDLAVEVISPDDRYKDVERKAKDYVDGGAQLVWVVDLRKRTVTVHRPNSKPLILSEGEELDGAQVVPGFRCAVAEIFT